MFVLAGLIHPNLPRIYDYFVENQRWYFVMDFLEGETLEAYLRKRKNRPLPVEEVLDSGIQLATALDYLYTHQSPLGLKNLTLRNIWRTPDGKLYLLDTGTAPPVTADPDQWLEQAPLVHGSWWPRWSSWLLERSGQAKKAPASLGSRAYPPLGPAPGTYVHG